MIASSPVCTLHTTMSDANICRAGTCIHTVRVGYIFVLQEISRNFSFPILYNMIDCGEQCLHKTRNCESARHKHSIL